MVCQTCRKRPFVSLAKSFQDACGKWQTNVILHLLSVAILTWGIWKVLSMAGPFPAILGKGPCPKLGKMINLTSKLGEINDIEHYKGSKILTSKSSYFRLYYAKHTT